MSEAAHPSSGSRAAASSTSSELELIEQLKRQLAGPLFAAVSDQFSHLQNTVLSYQNKLQYAELKIRVLEERLRLVRIAKYGPGSEKLSDAQLELLELEPGVSSAEVQAESERPPVQPSTKTRRQHPGRQELPANLPRVERILKCTPEQCVCKGCGKETVVIGHEESSQLDVEPAKYFVLVSKREKRVCKSCEEQGVVSAPLPPRIIEKCLASDQIVIDTVVSKYCDHQPLYRRSAMLERDSGVELSRATLDGWVLKVGELLIPMASAMRQELLRGTYIQADETPVDVQMQEGRGKNHQAYLWQYSRPGGTVVFDFRLGRGRDGPKQFLGQFEGLLQTDGYAAYDQIGGPKMVHAGCWSHAERYFSEAVQLNLQDPMATAIVARVDELFSIDAEARCQGLNVEARHALRQQQSRPLLGEIRKQIEAARSMALPGGALAKACNYTLTLWDKLTRFLEYPELELSNNLAENSMRPVALGRRNWIHIGSAQAGPKIAAILSVVESCRRMKIPVRDYLAAILPGLADLPIQRLPELTPSAWVAQHS
ncbi:MAG: IS66 family transposase [Candidatus Sulfotelmatobacter sp.]